MSSTATKTRVVIGYTLAHVFLLKHLSAFFVFIIITTIEIMLLYAAYCVNAREFKLLQSQTCSPCVHVTAHLALDVNAQELELYQALEHIVRPPVARDLQGGDIFVCCIHNAHNKGITYIYEPAHVTTSALGNGARMTGLFAVGRSRFGRMTYTVTLQASL
jgi:hypothetical protein